MKTQKIKYGKSIEAKVISDLLRLGADVYTPAADDSGVDIVAKLGNGAYQDIQVKSKQSNSLFANIRCESRDNYWFVFWSETNSDRYWIIPSSEFIKIASKNTKIDSKHIGTYTINLSDTKYKKYNHENLLPIFK